MIREIIFESKKNKLAYKNLNLQKKNKPFYTKKQNKINKPKINIKSNNIKSQNNSEINNDNIIFNLNKKTKINNIKIPENKINNFIYIIKNSIKSEKKIINSSIRK